MDGNDAAAVYQCALSAISKARAGKGPTVLEALTYRLGDHTTADDATRYRDPALVQKEWAREPLARLRAYLLRKGMWSAGKEAALLKQCAEDVDAGVKAYLETKTAGPEAMFDYLYASLPRALDAQRACALRTGTETR